MIFFLAFSLGGAALLLSVAYAIAQSMVRIEEQAGIWPSPAVPPAQPVPDDHFTCWCCDTGPWHRDWDPIGTGLTSFKRAKAGFGLCPNCSGAD